MTPEAAPERPLRVLVVDDHATNRAVLEIILGMIEAHIICAEDGAQAVAVFKAETFDVVLMDLQMPVMDGLQATREIRSYEAEQGLPRTPVLVVSANAMSDHVAAAHAAGADRHIAKPVVPGDVLRAIEEDLQRARADEAGRSTRAAG